MARLPGSEALCINFYAPSATSTNQSKFIRAWLVIVTGGLSELAREHCLAHVLAEITPHRYPPIEGILCIIQVDTPIPLVVTRSSERVHLTEVANGRC